MNESNQTKTEPSDEPVISKPRNKSWKASRTKGWLLLLATTSFLGFILLTQMQWQYALSILSLVHLLIILLWKLPKWQILPWRDRVEPNAKIEPKDFIQAENNSRVTLAQIIGGILVLIGLYFTSQNLRVAHEGQITDRFTKAIDQLGNDNKPDVTIGGIYALGRIARDSEEDHWPIMEILTAYIRRRVPWKADKASQPHRSSIYANVPGSDVVFELPLDDVQAIMEVLRQRNLRYESGKNQYLRLDATYLQGVSLKNAFLKKASFINADLTGADLDGANLEETRFTKAILTGINCNRATFKGSDLTGADLTHAQLDEARFENANLTRVDLRAADFTVLHLQGAILNGTRLEGLDLRNTIGLTQDQIGLAVIDEETQLPLNLIKRNKKQ